MTAVFTKLGSLLPMTCRHCPVQGAPDVSGHGHSVHAISGHIQFGTQSMGATFI